MKIIDSNEIDNIMTKQASKQASKQDSSSRVIESDKNVSGFGESILSKWNRTDSKGKGLQRPAKDSYILNAMPDGTCRTIKNQYYKNSIPNFESHGSFGATGVIEVVRKNT